MRRRTKPIKLGGRKSLIYMVVIILALGAKHVYSNYIEPNAKFIEQLSDEASQQSVTAENSLRATANSESQSGNAAPRSKGKTYRSGWAELPATPKQNKLYTTHHYYKPSARNYSVCYSSERHCPLWVAAPVHRSYKGEVKRNDSYAFDPTISIDIQPLLSRSYGEYTRGHMLGSAERTASRAMNEQTFYATNIAPQIRDGFNARGGAWNNIERVVDRQICPDTLYVVTGCIFEDYTHTDSRRIKASTTINKGDGKRISVPTAYYKAMLRTKRGSTGKSVMECSQSELKCAAIIVPHTSAAGYKPSSKDLISIKELERLTGMEFFANVKNAPKQKVSDSDWNL